MISLMLLLGLFAPTHITTSSEESALWRAVAEGHPQAWNYQRVTVSGVVQSIRTHSVIMTPSLPVTPSASIDSHNSGTCIGLLVSRSQFRRLRNGARYHVRGSFIAVDLHPGNNYVTELTRNGRTAHLTCPNLEGFASFIYVEHVSPI